MASIIRASLFLLIWSCSLENKQNPVTDLPVHEDWLYQADSLLMPYWMTEEALGSPAGQFNTYRTNNGEVISPGAYDYNLIPEYIREYIVTGNDRLLRQFVRMISRQINAYCIAFHMTGNESYLTNAKIGLDYLIANNVFANNSAVTFFKDGVAYPKPPQRTVQDLAYALLGPSVYYYITRDPEILALILPIKRQIIENYFNNSDLSGKSKIMKWTLRDFEADSAHYMNLLAPMDMINAHLLLMVKTVPDSLEEEYRMDLKNLAYSIKDNFYNEWSNSFLGNLNQKTVFAGSSDLGHSIKNFWMLYLNGELLADEELSTFAYSNGTKLLETSYIENLGRWGSIFQDSSKRIDPNILSWQYAEFDQTSITFSLVDRTIYDRYLKSTFMVWFENLIDHEDKEIHWGLNEKNEPHSLGFKIGMWKNGFHSMEHALIGLIGTAAYYEQPLSLYFYLDSSIDPNKTVLDPYYFKAKESERKLVTPNADRQSSRGQTVEVIYTGVH